LEIGDNVSIGLGALIWSHDSMNLNIRGINTREHSRHIVRKPTKIGSNCFIGGPVVIMPGVTIGDKCVVAPMSVVYEDLPDRSVYKPFRELYDFLRVKDSLLAEIAGLKARVETLEQKARES
jgi:acetyltransferase-like isoleucine patch superfamily enzyme